MGTYLSTPVLDKHAETGCDLDSSNDGGAEIPPSLNWAVVDMQGWRKSMEDAHVARTDVPPPGGGGGGGDGTNGEAPAAKVFAVFDGHGGAEVARYCQTQLVRVLTSQELWRNSTPAKPTTAKAAAPSDSSEGAPSGPTAENGAASTEAASSPEEELGSRLGRALVKSFHAIDRLVDDPRRRDEVLRWRVDRPPPYVHAQANGTGGGGSAEVLHKEPAATAEALLGKKALPGNTEGELLEQEKQTRRHTARADDMAADMAAAAMELQGLDGDGDVAMGEFTTDGDEEEGGVCSKGGTDAQAKGDDADNTPPSSAVSSQTGGGGAPSDDPGKAEGGNYDDFDDDDGEVFEDSLTGDEDVDAGDGVVRDDSDDEKEGEAGEEGEAESGKLALSANDAYALFQKLLHMSGGAAGADDEGDAGGEEGASMADGYLDVAEGEIQTAANSTTVALGEGLAIPTREQLLNPPSGVVAPSASVPTRIQNGRKACNLPDYPVHAGCTSVVAVIAGRTLVVANAGDSRAVLCRAGGGTEALSYDHKPLQEREMTRITEAGGFVNQFGRVNGNLNLSRSIGDLKYKQVPGISPADQMITAEPDIIHTKLFPDDEFLILGCDGIWDCLTNEECVRYVRDRIDTKTPREIGTEMLDEIVSADPRASQGIGGDNMTIMIVDLLPHSRSYVMGR